MRERLCIFAFCFVAGALGAAMLEVVSTVEGPVGFIDDMDEERMAAPENKLIQTMTRPGS